MAKITKQLKYATFEYNEENKEFCVQDANGNKITLNKIYSFAFTRFVIRMAQRNWFRSNKLTKELIREEEEEVEIEDPNQLNLF
jgi:hypothetical protein